MQDEKLVTEFKRLSEQNENLKEENVVLKATLTKIEKSLGNLATANKEPNMNNESQEKKNQEVSQNNGNDNGETRVTHGHTENELQSKITSLLKNEIMTMKNREINEGVNKRRDYILTTNTKYEHFYDFFSSELRTLDLLHIVEKDLNMEVIDEKILTDQNFKVRDILINRIDTYSHIKDPVKN